MRNGAGVVSESKIFTQVLNGGSWQVQAQSIASKLHCGCEHNAAIMVDLEAKFPDKVALGGEIRLVAACPGCKQEAIFHSKWVTGAEMMEAKLLLPAIDKKIKALPNRRNGKRFRPKQDDGGNDHEREDRRTD